MASQLAVAVGSKLSEIYPEHFGEMMRCNYRASSCRLRMYLVFNCDKYQPNRIVTKKKPSLHTGGQSPFSALTVNTNFTAHSHTDSNDLKTGLSAIVTLLPDPQTKHHQHHQLPLVSFRGQPLGVSIWLPHGSVAFEAARLVTHQTTPLGGESCGKVHRMSIILFQHRDLDKPCHGAALRE